MGIVIRRPRFGRFDCVILGPIEQVGPRVVRGIHHRLHFVHVAVFNVPVSPWVCVSVDGAVGSARKLDAAAEVCDLLPPTAEGSASVPSVCGVTRDFARRSGLYATGEMLNLAVAQGGVVKG